MARKKKNLNSIDEILENVAIVKKSPGTWYEITEPPQDDKVIDKALNDAKSIITKARSMASRIILEAKQSTDTRTKRILESTNKAAKTVNEEVNKKIEREYGRRKEEEIKNRLKQDESKMTLNEWLFMDTHRNNEDLERILKSSM